MNTPVPVDTDTLGKLLCLAKSMDDAFRDNPKSKAVNRVLIRTTSEGTLTFQAKGGHLWRFFAITLSGREQEYDLGKNFASLQSLFSALSQQCEGEIRRAAQGMAMYKDTVIDTQDAVATLRSLEQTLNSLIDHIIAKKLGRISDDERKKSIKCALENMKISFQPQKESSASTIKEVKRQSRKRSAGHAESSKLFEEAMAALDAKIAVKKGAYPFEAMFLQGRQAALRHCRKELVLWLEGASTPSKEFLAFGSVKNLLNEWDRASPELSQLKQQAHDINHSIESCLQAVRDRLVSKECDQQVSCRQLQVVEEKLSALLQQKNEGLLEQFRQAGEHYLVLSQQFQLDVQALFHTVQSRKMELAELEGQRQAIEKQLLAQSGGQQGSCALKERRGQSRKKLSVHRGV